MIRRSISLFPVLVALVMTLGFIPVFAQDKPADNMEVLREKIKADKKLLIAQNMELTETEAEKFWPVYESFQKELAEINRQTADLIRMYADNYANLSDDDAKKMIDQFIEIEKARARQFETDLPKFSGVLPVKKVARYYQLENKINAVVAYGLAREIPLVK